MTKDLLKDIGTFCDTVFHSRHKSRVDGHHPSHLRKGGGQRPPREFISSLSPSSLLLGAGDSPVLAAGHRMALLRDGFSVNSCRATKWRAELHSDQCLDGGSGIHKTHHLSN